MTSTGAAKFPPTRPHSCQGHANSHIFLLNLHCSFLWSTALAFLLATDNIVGPCSSLLFLSRFPIMNLATTNKTRREAASVSQQSHKSAGTDSTADLLDPVLSVGTPEAGKENLDHALARIGSDATPASSSWRKKIAPIKWMRSAGGSNLSHHKRNKSADAVASTTVPWLSADGISLGGTRNNMTAPASVFMASPTATKRASELLRRAASCDQKDEGEMPCSDDPLYAQLSKAKKTEMQ